MKELKDCLVVDLDEHDVEILHINKLIRLELPKDKENFKKMLDMLKRSKNSSDFVNIRYKKYFDEDNEKEVFKLISVS